MKMRKAITLLLALALVFSLAACGGKSSGNSDQQTQAADGQQSSDVSADNGNGTSDQPAADDGLKPEDGASLVVWADTTEKDFVTELGKQFTEKYNVPVKYEEVKPPDAVTKMTNDGPAGVGGDVFVFPHDQLGRAADAGLVLPNDVFADATKAENADAAIKAVTYKGQLYGYPKSVETYALMYNKDLLPNPPATWDELIQTAKTLTDAPNKKFGFMMEVGNFYFGYPFFASYGGYVFGKDGTDPTDIGLNSDAAVQGLKVYQQLKDVLPVKNADITYDIKKGLFTSGKLAMDLNGPWTIADYKNAGINLGVAPIPAFGDKPAVSFSGVQAWYVNAFTKYPNAAQLFARFASSKEGQLLNNKMNGIIPANKEAGDDPQIKDDPVLSGFFAQFQNSQPMPSIPEMAQVWSPIGAAMVEIWDKGADPKAAADKAVQQIKDGIKTNNAK